MPESHGRKKQVYTPPQEKAPAAARQHAGRWVVPVMLVCFLVGLAWIVVFYLAGSDIPGMRDLSNWNILVGMGLIAIGFVVSTQWR
ncbi:cell division protein CrgA [Actinopolymorpha pittospori]|uniref:Cell division protein CrgA n=1 Tax=Actinopolymorpha pittospori TaxID=648752 RepID=A0A927RAH8_9ACTN|nr:putative membrane protein [Actinopolymorpha pittospori]